jgi:aminobenzoyl-glutamate utilization protein B
MTPRSPDRSSLLLSVVLRSAVLLFSLALLLPAGTAAQQVDRLRRQAWEVVDAHATELAELSDAVWRYAETSLKEVHSSAVLADYLERQGFRVERGVAELPTAFTATWGSGRPVIGILAEFDALPGLSNVAAPQQLPITEGAPGHGCGHNLFGTGSVGAALAAKEVLVRNGLSGTIRLFGCPAEETVIGKVYMAKAGVFDGLDVCLDWHPGTETGVGFASSQAMNNFTVEFFGKTAHGAGDPWHGRSALDAVELMDHAVNMLREHVVPTTRIHYVITDGGGAPNVVPAYAKVWYYVRDKDRAGVEPTYQWVLKTAEGAAMATQTTFKVTLITGVHAYLLNRPLTELLNRNLHTVGPPVWTEEEQAFARTIQRELGVEEKGLSTTIKEMPAEEQPAGGGSTDVAEVSRICPTARITVVSSPIGSPGHSWPITACGGMSIGHTTVVTAAKVLGATAVELLVSPEVIAAAQAEFQKKTEGRPYQSPIPKEQKPPLPPPDH